MARALLVALPIKTHEKVKKALKKTDIVIDQVSTYETAYEKIQEDVPDIVISQGNGDPVPLSGLNKILSARGPITPLVVMLEKNNMKEALGAMHVGAFDCIAPPYNPFEILATVKKAGDRFRRNLVAGPVVKQTRPFAPYVTAFLGLCMLVGGYLHQSNGPPPFSVSLGSVNLAGLFWSGRQVWICDWYDSNIIHYQIRKGLLRKKRTFKASGLYKVNGWQPMMVCPTPVTLMTVGTDLKFRSHQKQVGLPTLFSAPVPGTRPVGIAWDGEYLWSADGATNLLYRHSEDFKVIETVKSMIPNPSGITFHEGSIYVVGQMPLKMARLELRDNGYVWHGPYDVRHLLTEGVEPTGIGVEFDRIWAISSGSPVLVSSPLKPLLKKPSGWEI